MDQIYSLLSNFYSASPDVNGSVLWGRSSQAKQNALIPSIFLLVCLFRDALGAASAQVIAHCYGSSGMRQIDLLPPAQLDREVNPMLSWHWANVYYVVPVSRQHWVNASCFLGGRRFAPRTVWFGFLLIGSGRVEIGQRSFWAPFLSSGDSGWKKDKRDGWWIHLVGQHSWNNWTAKTVPNKHDMVWQCCFNVGPASQTVEQHWNNIAWIYRICFSQTIAQ